MTKPKINLQPIHDMEAYRSGLAGCQIKRKIVLEFY